MTIEHLYYRFSFFPARLLLLFLVGLVDHVVHADTSGFANSLQDYYVFLTGMVDFDQVRDTAPGIVGLPGGGGMYCVPTASSDLMAYIAAHGYNTCPGFIGPGVPNTNWLDPEVYNFASVYIDNMGDDMGTDPEDGTTSTDLIFQAVCDRVPKSKLDVVYYSRTNTWSPKSVDIASYMFNGGVVQFAYGRWEVGGADDTPIERTGGHAVVMTKVDKRSFQGFDEDETRISFANPSFGGSVCSEIIVPCFC